MIVRRTNTAGINCRQRANAIIWKALMIIATVVLILNNLSVMGPIGNQGRLASSVVDPDPRAVNATALSASNEMEPKAQPHHAMNSSCSCWNSTATPECCQRTFRPTHKMGYELSQSLQRHFSMFFRFHTKRFEHHGFETVKKLPLNKKEHLGFDAHTKLKTKTDLDPPPADQRDVIITRNIYSAIASGYLYHKKGKECHLHPYHDNKPWPVTWPKVHNLHHFWEFTTVPIDPSHKKRSLCLYLANNSVKDGLKVYIDWVFSVYYNAIDEWEGHPDKTLHVCFEDLTHDGKDVEVLRTLQDFFFPMKNVPNYDGWRPGAEIYAGGHSTSSDPTLRNEIRRISEELDASVFGGKLAAFQKQYRCGE